MHGRSQSSDALGLLIARDDVTGSSNNCITTYGQSQRLFMYGYQVKKRAVI